jgi:hypothetical protein
MSAGEVIAKLADDVYFMRVDNGVTQVPPLRTREADHEATSRSPADNRRTTLEESYRRTPTALGHLLEDLLRAVTALVALAAVAPSWLMATPAAEAAAAGAPHTGLEGEPVAEAIAKAKATQIATSPVSHAAATMPTAESNKFDARNPPQQARTTASPPSLVNFAICFSQRNSSLWGSPSMMRSKIQYSGSDATPSPSRMLVATTI